MKLPILLLALASLLSWGSFQAQNTAQAPIVAAARRQPSVAATAPTEAQASQPQTTTPSGPTASGAPLFRPAAAPADHLAPQPGETFQLIGLAGLGEARVAFLRDSADAQVFQVRAGEEVRGWTIENIDQRCAALRQARRRQNICLQ